MTSDSKLHIDLSPSGTDPERWQVDVRNGTGAPTQKLILPPITVSQLDRLRQETWNGTVDELREIGGQIWDELLAGHSIGMSDNPRLVLVFKPLTPMMPRAISDSTTSRAAISIAEVPYEALFQKQFNRFVSLHCSVSRALHEAPDLDPRPAPHPLKILVIVAAPADLDPAGHDRELKVIENILCQKSLAESIRLCTVSRATVTQVCKAIETFNPHIIHFIGHGDFDDDGPYLDFEADSDDGSDDGPPHWQIDPRRRQGGRRGRRPSPRGPAERRRVTAEMLGKMIERGQPPASLVILSACVSAAPVGAGPTSPHGPAFDGVAQRLVQSQGIAASIAMQFVLEDWAAEAFASGFYKALVRDLRLDDCVKEARAEIVLKRGEHERAWVTPVVYSRCKSGQIFESERWHMHSPDTIVGFEKATEILRNHLTELWRRVRDSYHLNLVNRSVDRWHELSARQAKEVDSCLRVEGGVGPRGAPLECSLHLHRQGRAVFRSLKVTLHHPGLRFVGVANGPGSKQARMTCETSDGTATTLTVTRTGRRPKGASRAMHWEVARLSFEPIPDASPPPAGPGCVLAEIIPQGIQVTMGKKKTAWRGISGWLCIR